MALFSSKQIPRIAASVLTLSLGVIGLTFALRPNPLGGGILTQDPTTLIQTPVECDASSLAQQLAWPVGAASPVCQAQSFQPTTSGSWITALDCDFRTQTTQSFTTDGNYTICGVTFTKWNSANEATHAVLTNGVGIVFQPAAATDVNATTRSAPLLSTLLDTLIGSWGPDVGLRAWLYTSADNAAANFDGNILAVENVVSVTPNNNYRIKRGFANTPGYIAGIDNAGAGNASIVTGIDAATEPVDNVTLVLLPNGVAGGRGMFFAGPWNDAGQAFPPVDILDALILSNWTGSTTTDVTLSIGQAKGWDVAIGANRAGSATAYSTTLARLKIQYHP